MASQQQSTRRWSRRGMPRMAFESHLQAMTNSVERLEHLKDLADPTRFGGAMYRFAGVTCQVRTLNGSADDVSLHQVRVVYDRVAKSPRAFIVVLCHQFGMPDTWYGIPFERVRALFEAGWMMHPESRRLTAHLRFVAGRAYVDVKGVGRVDVTDCEHGRELVALVRARTTPIAPGGYQHPPLQAAAAAVLTVTGRGPCKVPATEVAGVQAAGYLQRAGIALDTSVRETSHAGLWPVDLLASPQGCDPRLHHGPGEIRLIEILSDQTPRRAVDQLGRRIAALRVIDPSFPWTVRCFVIGERRHRRTVTQSIRDLQAPGGPLAAIAARFVAAEDVWAAYAKRC